MDTVIKTVCPEGRSEMPEVKTPSYNHVNIDELSEWELARMTSKTWSMEQE